MNDREYRAQVKRLRALLQPWHRRMGLSHWQRIHHEFHRDSTWHHENGHDDCVAVTRTHHEYKEASVHWHMPSVADFEDGDLEAVVVHEFTHMILQGLVDAFVADDGTDAFQARAIERVTTDVTQAVMYTWEAAQSRSSR